MEDSLIQSRKQCTALSGKLTLEEAMDMSQNRVRDGLTNRRLLCTSLHVFDYACLLAYVFVQGLFNSAVRGTP